MTRKHVFLLIALIASIALAAIFILGSRTKNPSTELYRANKVSFSYPTTWQVSFCSPEGGTLQLPETLRGVNGEKSSYPLVLKGFAWANCDANKSLVFSGSSKVEKCNPDDYVHQKTNNNLTISSYRYDDIIQKVYIQKEPCSKEPLFVFGFYDSKQDPRSFSLENLIKSEPMGVPYDKLQESKQFEEIIKFAESIKLEE